MLHLESIYEVKNWVELFGKYEQLNSIKLCSTCWSDKVKVFNYFRAMKSKENKSENQGEKTYKFKAGFEETEIHFKGLHTPITQATLNENINLVIDNKDLMELIELV